MKRQSKRRLRKRGDEETTGHEEVAVRAAGGCFGEREKGETVGGGKEGESFFS